MCNIDDILMIGMSAQKTETTIDVGFEYSTSSCAHLLSKSESKQVNYLFCDINLDRRCTFYYCPFAFLVGGS